MSERPATQKRRKPISSTTERPQSLREEHKLVTRARIRRSARICFARDGVRDVSLEMIAAEAGIGRTTLYQYYPSKGPLLADLMEQSLRATDRVYQKLVAVEKMSFAAVRQWLQDYLGEVEDHSSTVDMFHCEMESDDQIRRMMREHWKRTITLLGARFPIFDIAHLTGVERTRRQFLLEQALSELESFCGAASLSDYHLDKRIVTDVVAERFFEVLTTDVPT